MKRLLILMLVMTICCDNLFSQLALSQQTENDLPINNQGATAMADVDGDNDLDLFISGNNNGIYSSKLFINNGFGLYSESVQNTFTGVILSDVSFVDIENDGDQDLIYMGLDSDFDRVTKVYLNNGAGVFIENVNHNFIGLNSGSITVGDVDIDGDMDLILAGEIGATAYTELFINDGEGVFTIKPNTPFDQVSRSAIKFSDVDNDNDLDVFVTGYVSGSYIAKLYNNDGLGNFTISANTDFTGVAFSAVEFADIDGDSADDIIVTGRINDDFERISNIYLNDGNGNFDILSTADLDGVESGSLGLADIDNDSDIDLIITGLSNTNESINNLYMNDGIGNFSLNTSYNLDGVYGTKFQIFADVDNNNEPDVFLFGADFNSTQRYAELYLNVDDVPSEQKDILVNLYNSTDGNNWSENSLWNTVAPVEEWYGVTVTGNTIEKIELPNNNLSGSIPSELLELSDLTTLVFFNNHLSGEIPDMGSLNNFTTLHLSYNMFDFIDFEANFESNSLLSDFQYSPQRNRDDLITFDAVIGNDYSFSMTTIAGTDVQYQWYRGTLISGGEAMPNENTKILNLINVQSEDLDAYSCIATSNLIPNLKIRREFVELKGPVSQIERDALIAFYNATGGENWLSSTGENWNTSAPVSTWVGVTTTGNKVTRLVRQSVGLSGQIPETIGNLTNLEGLYIGLGDLDLIGPIPESIGNLINLRFLWFQGTGMSGELPESIGNLVNLQELRCIGNNFYGPIPESIGNLTQLSNLGLSGAQLSGFPYSNFSGALPASMGNLINLSSLNLDNNSFEGVLPVELANMSNVSNVDISHNNFEGVIPFNSPNANINIAENHFSFSDLELFVQTGNYNTLDYSPQKTQDAEESIESGIGANITLNVNDTNLNRSSEVSAVNNAYQWYKDSIAILGATEPSYQITNAQENDSGVYHCEITNDVLPDLVIIRAPIVLLVDKTFDIAENSKFEMSLHPNPTSSWLTIKTVSLNNASLSIHDINGRIVLEEILHGEINSINVENIQKGTYILSLKGESKKVVQRFIKQ